LTGDEASVNDTSKHAPQAQIAHTLPRILELQRYIKSISTSTYPNRPVASARAIVDTLKDAHLSSSCPTCQGHYDSTDSIVQINGEPTYEHQLEELLLCKATAQTYGTVLNTILEQTLAIHEHIWYWDSLLSSHRHAGLYSLQTSPIRLWSWSKSVIEGVKSKNTGLSDGWKQFYSLVKDVVKERSIADLQAKAVSPLAQVRNEAIQKQRELKRIRDVNSNALGYLLGEGLSTIEEWAYHSGTSSQSLYVLGSGREDVRLFRSISFLEAVLSNAQDTSANVDTFESNVSAATKQGAWSEGSESKTLLPSDLSGRLILLLNEGLPKYAASFDRQLSTYGRPSPIIRYWLPATVLIFSSGTILRILLNRKQDVLNWVREFGATVRDFYANWVVDPLRKLVGTIRHDEGSEIAIMSKRSLQGDRESLERMVVDFASAEQGSLNETDIQNIRTSIREGDLTTVLKAYEKDMQKPIWGALRGKLITALLIQIQKTKVDVEVAMGGIDTLLKSQELVFG
jgi:nuclear-control-of-ATPase protein 2